MIVITPELAGFIAWGLRLVIDQLERDGLRHRIPTTLRHLERWSTAAYEGQHGTPLDVPAAVADAPPRLLHTIEEAARMAAVSPKTIRRAIAAGDLDAVRLGPQTVRLRAADLHRWIDAHAA